MFPEMNQHLAELYKCFNKNLNSFHKLNTETVAHVVNNHYLDELAQANKPEDVVATQIKYAMEANIQAVDYMRQALELILKSQADLNQQFNALAGDVVRKAKHTKSSAGTK